MLRAIKENMLHDINSQVIKIIMHENYSGQTKDS